MPSNEYKSNACINFVECRHYRRQSIMSSNYSQNRNKKNRAKNNETFLQQIRASNDGWCILQHFLSLPENPKKSLWSDGAEHLCQEVTSQRCQRHLWWLLLRFIKVFREIFKISRNYFSFPMRKSSNLVNALLKCSNFALHLRCSANEGFGSA